MLRVPAIFAVVNLFVLLAQSEGNIPTPGALTYGAMVCAGFTAVWLQLWKLHTTLIRDKNTLILELTTEVRAKDDRIAELEASERHRLLKQLEGHKSD